MIPRVRSRAGQAFAAAIIAVLATVACRDSGLPNRNTPVEEAAQREPPYPLYESAGSAQAGALGLYTIGERRYLPSAAAERIPPLLLRPLGVAGGQQIVALVWDTEPYDRLYLSAPDGRYHPLTRVP